MKKESDESLNKINDERRLKWLAIPESERHDQLTLLVGAKELKDLVDKGIALLEQYILKENLDLSDRMPSRRNTESKLQVKLRIRGEHYILAQTLLIYLQGGCLTVNIFQTADNIKQCKPKDSVGSYQYPIIFNQLTAFSPDDKMQKKELICKHVSSSLATQYGFVAPLVKIVVDYISDNCLHGLDVNEPPSQFMPT